MTILYIHQYFKTPQMGGGTRSYELSRYFLEKGHNVILLTSHNNKKTSIEYIDNIKVYWIGNYYDNSFGILRRLISFTSFMIKSLIIALKIENINICYATSTPLSVGITALLLKKLKGLRYVFEVRDLWPEFPIQMRAIKNPILIKLLYWLEKTIYEKSESIIALSPGMKEGILKYHLNKKILIVSNSCDLNLFFPHKINMHIASKYNLTNKFNIIHFGALGLANGLEYIIETAKICQENNESDIQFIIIGEGRTKNDLLEMSKKSNLQNILFFGMTPKKELAEIVNICDISITSFLNLPILYTNSPNKLFDSLSSGKVCFVNSNGWTRKLLEENKCGFYVDPDCPEDFYKKILIAKNNPKLKKDMEKNSRKLAETEFNRKKLNERLYNNISEIVKNMEKQ